MNSISQRRRRNERGMNCGSMMELMLQVWLPIMTLLVRVGSAPLDSRVSPSLIMNFISEPTTELTDMNCGRLMELHQVLLWLPILILTVMVSDPYAKHSFTVFNNELYFQGNDGTHGHELWKTDGTASGTVMVHDTTSGSFNGYAKDLTVFNDELYFRIWREVLFGSLTEPLPVKLLNFHHYLLPALSLLVFNNELYFHATDGTHGYELWKYDGTNANMIADINVGSASGLHILQVKLIIIVVQSCSMVNSFQCQRWN